MAEDSVSDAIADFNARGYTGGFRAEGEGLRDVVTGRTHRPERLRIDELRRFEGESDPGDSSVVFALSDAEGRALGTYIVVFGAEMDRVDAEVVRRLRDGRRGGSGERPTVIG